MSQCHVTSDIYVSSDSPDDFQQFKYVLEPCLFYGFIKNGKVPVANQISYFPNGPAMLKQLRNLENYCCSMCILCDYLPHAYCG